jgi:hypothetical protein
MVAQIAHPDPDPDNPLYDGISGSAALETAERAAAAQRRALAARLARALPLHVCLCALDMSIDVLSEHAEEVDKVAPADIAIPAVPAGAGSTAERGDGVPMLSASGRSASGRWVPSAALATSAEDAPALDAAPAPAATDVYPDAAGAGEEEAAPAAGLTASERRKLGMSSGRPKRPPPEAIALPHGARLHTLQVRFRALFQSSPPRRSLTLLFVQDAEGPVPLPPLVFAVALPVRFELPLGIKVPTRSPWPSPSPDPLPLALSLPHLTRSPWLSPSLAST